MIIGKFTRSGNAYTGKLVTLTHKQALKFEPAERGADYQVTLEGVEVGAAWKKTAKDTGKAYLSVKLDSPFLAAPVNGALIEQEDDAHILVWNRDQRKAD